MTKNTVYFPCENKFPDQFQNNDSLDFSLLQ